ncbi:unnamed protein product [Heterobilharzia americana]|nr:unnamed protein product [Heterobilharzia americana]
MIVKRDENPVLAHALNPVDFHSNFGGVIQDPTPIKEVEMAPMITENFTSIADLMMIHDLAVDEDSDAKDTQSGVDEESVQNSSNSRSGITTYTVSDSQFGPGQTCLFSV